MKYVVEKHTAKGGEAFILRLPQWDTFSPVETKKEIVALIERGERYIAKVVGARPTFMRLVRGIEVVLTRIDEIELELANLCSAVGTSELSSLSTEIGHLTLSFRTRVWTDRLLHRAHRSFKHSPKYARLNPEEKSAFDVQFMNFAAYGIHLSATARRKIKKIEHELTELDRRISDNASNSANTPSFFVLDESMLEGVPDHVRNMMRTEAELRGGKGWALCAKHAIVSPILRGAKVRLLRKLANNALTSLASDIGPGGREYDNRPLIERSLRLRRRYANIMKHKTYSHYATSGLILSSPTAVTRFLDALHKKVMPIAEREFQQLNAFARKELGYDLEPWDIEYARHLFYRKRYRYTSEDLKRYIDLESVALTLFRLARKLYGIKIRERKHVPSWHPSVRFFEVLGADGVPLGAFYLDAFARSGELTKQQGMLWAMQLLYRRRMSEGISLPVAVLHLDCVHTGENSRVHLAHTDVVGFAHEFGHLMCDLLTPANYVLTGPKSLEEDAIEIPSMFWETWAWNPDVLHAMTKDHVTKKSAPRSLIRSVIEQRYCLGTFGRWGLHEFLRDGYTDILLYSEKPTKGIIERVYRRVSEKVYLYSHGEWDRYPNSFTNIFSADSGGYFSVYFVYPYSWSLAAAIYVEHNNGRRGIDPVVGRRFLREFFGKLPLKTSKDNINSFFGRKRLYTPEKLAETLLKHLRLHS